MGTLRQIVSDIRSRDKLLSYDNLISDRFVASEVKSSAFLLIKRETDRRLLWGIDTLFTTIPCLEMEEVPLAECCDYTSDKKISRSKYKLPKIAEGKYGYLISGVTNIEGSEKISYMSPNRYANALKLGLKKVDTVYWIQNSYLYTTNPNLEMVKISAFFQEDLSEDILNSCNCNDDEKECINPLDLEFNLPSYLLSSVKDLVTRTLLSTYEQTHKDTTSNDIEDINAS